MPKIRALALDISFGPYIKLEKVNTVNTHFFVTESISIDFKIVFLPAPPLIHNSKLGKTVEAAYALALLNFNLKIQLLDT